MPVVGSSSEMLYNHMHIFVTLVLGGLKSKQVLARCTVLPAKYQRHVSICDIDAATLQEMCTERAMLTPD